VPQRIDRDVADEADRGGVAAFAAIITCPVCRAPRAASARWTGAAFIKFGRAPTTWRMCID